MTKLRDKISTLQDLDEFTEYILNPASNDRIVEVFDPTHIVTEQMIVDIDTKVKGAAIERVYEILNGEIEWDDSTSDDIFKSLDSQLSLVSTFNLHNTIWRIY